MNLTIDDETKNSKLQTQHTHIHTKIIPNLSSHKKGSYPSSISSESLVENDDVISLIFSSRKSSFTQGQTGFLSFTSPGGLFCRACRVSFSCCCSLSFSNIQPNNVDLNNYHNNVIVSPAKSNVAGQSCWYYKEKTTQTAQEGCLSGRYSLLFYFTPFSFFSPIYLFHFFCKKEKKHRKKRKGM